MAYIYNAALLCDSCGDKTKRELEEAVNVDCRSCKWKGPVTKALLDTENNAGWLECPECKLQTVAFDEYSYDSDEYPKYVDDDTLESDSPDHCGDCGEFLENALTAEGLAYVREAIASSNGGIVGRYGNRSMISRQIAPNATSR